MDVTTKIQLIDEAINHILLNLKNGLEIKEYEIDGISIKKRSPLELIEELNKLKRIVISKNRVKSVQYVFKG